MSLWKFIINRVGYHWQIYTTLLFGVILSSALIASGPLIVNTVLDLSLPYKLHSSEPLDGNIQLTTYEHFNKEDYYDFNNYIQGLLLQHLGKYISTVVDGGTSGYIYPWIDGVLSRDQRISLGYYQDVENRSHILEGEWPIQTYEDKKEIQVVIGANFSMDYQLSIGDRFPLSSRSNESEPSIWFIISGIISENDPQDIYWFGDHNPLRNNAEGRWSSSYSAFVSKDDFYNLTEKYFHTARSEFTWNVIFDPYTITFDQINPLSSQLNILREDLKGSVPQVSVDTNIADVFNTFSSRARIVRITLYILIGEALFIAIYYITMISASFSEYLGVEFSNLSSRGSSSKDILFIQLLDAFVLSGAAYVIGLMTAVVMLWFIAKIGPLSDVSHNSWNIRISNTSLLFTSLGILVCILSMLIPVNNALKRSIVIHSREVGRKKQSPIWQRYYLDICVLFIGIILMWRFYSWGGISAATQGGSIDWLLLFAPLILLIGAAALFNRIFPLLTKVLSTLIARGRSFGTTLAMHYISRNPGHISRLVFLLSLCMALGVLTTGMNETLDINEYERALYAVGSTARIPMNQPIQDNYLKEFSQIGEISLVYRSQGNLNIRAYRAVPTYDLLAIDPTTFIKVTKFRSDYAIKPMGYVLGNLMVDESDFKYPVIDLPGEPIAMGIWIFNNTLFSEDSEIISSLSVRGKIQTAIGETFIVNLQPLLNNDQIIDPSIVNATERQWHYFDGRLPPLSGEQYPLKLHSLWINIRATTNRYWRISLFIDDISLQDKNRNIFTIEDYENIENIWSVNDIQAEVIFTRRKIAHSGTGSLNLELPSQTRNYGGIGLSIASKTRNSSIPVLASHEFLSVTELDIGDEFFGNINSIRVPMVIAESVQYFPTLYEQPGKGFLVLPLEPLLVFLNQETIKPFNVNEIWLNSSSTDIANLPGVKVSNPNNIQTIEEERRIIKADALTLGLRSVTIISFWISLVLSVLGLSSTYYLNARSREIQFGILRSLGMSKNQLYAMLFVEQVFLIFLGLTAGLILGLLINMIILPGLPITMSDQLPVPPFLPHMNWMSIITLYAIISGAFIMIIGISTIVLWKTEIHKVLRIGME